MLAYLAVEAAHPHARQTLAQLFWPERPDAEALGALRFALSNLRAVLGDRHVAIPLLLIDRSRVQLNPQASVWVDVAAFRQQAAACEAAVRRGESPPAAALQTALALYRGDFMQGFNLGDSLDFESWALRTRERLERRRVALLHRLGAAQEAAGEHAAAAEAYRAILDSQPWDEDAHQGVMRALAAHGEPGAALAHYATCRRALHELGIEPGQTTAALYQRIQQAHGGADPLEEPPAAPFVARERELERLATALERALAGQGQTILITGEAGSGKTALLNAFARHALARHPDLLAVGGRCDAYAGIGQPYQPFIECVQMLAGEWDALPWAEQIGLAGRERLRQALPQVAQALVETAPALLERVVNRAELARRLPAPAATPPPAWRTRLQDGPASPALPGDLEAARLFEEVARLFTALTRQRPLALLLDDLQWSDAGSAALLFHLARRFVHSRVLLVAAYRPGDLDDRPGTGPHPLLGIVTELQRYGGDIRVDLEQVDAPAFVAAFLAQDPLLHPNRLDATFRAALAQRTGGNPLFTIELLRSLQAHHELHRAADGAWVSRPTLNWAHMPERVEAAIAGRVARLPDTWRDWLATAAVEGENFTAEVLARVHSVDIAGLLRDLSGPLGMGRGGRRLVQGENARQVGADAPARRLSHYRFRHILFQAYLYRQLDPVERARRHAAVGTALEDLYGGQPEEYPRHAAELARHFEAGGLPEKAALYHLEAGRRAVYLASPQVAVDHYRRGLARLAELPPTPARDRLKIHLYLALGAPFLLAGGWGGAERREAIQCALALLQKTGQAQHPDGQPPDAKKTGIFTLPNPGFGPELAEEEALLPALYEQADWLLNRGEFAQAGQLGAQILALAGEPASLPQAFAYRILGYNRLFQGDFPGARRHLAKALAIYHAMEEPPLMPWSGHDLDAPCRAALGFALAASGYLDQAWAQTTQALNRARRLKVSSIQGVTLIFACEVAVLRGDLPAQHALADELLHVAQTLGLPFFLAYGWAAEGYVRALQSPPGSTQVEASLDLIRRGMQVWESAETPTGRGLWTVRLAAACLHAGEIAAGLRLTTQILAAPDQPGIAIGLAQIYRLHGELLLRQEPPDRRAAESSFRQALDIARRQEAHTLELRAALSLARLWASERPAEGQRLLADVYAWFTEGLDTPDLQEAAQLSDARKTINNAVSPLS